MNDIVYFELNNWFSGRDYPPFEPFISWLGDDFKQTLCNEEWVKENKLVVVCGPLDMSMNYCITAPRKWIEENYPDLLTDKEYDYEVLMYYKGENTIKIEHNKFSNFLRYSEDDEPPIGRYGMHFLPYTEENIGVHWEEVDYYDEVDDDDE